MNKYICAFDNGVSACWSIFNTKGNALFYEHVSLKKQVDYTGKGNINRIDTFKLSKLLEQYGDSIAILEYPYKNPAQFKTTCSAMRSLEAVVITLEEYGMPIKYITAKEWQKVLLPGVKGRPALKKASMELGLKLFPQYEKLIKKERDADGLLIGYYAWRYL